VKQIHVDSFMSRDIGVNIGHFPLNRCQT